jgi:peptidoglycan/LPS O-acetylase OafA/YrhL
MTGTRKDGPEVDLDAGRAIDEHAAGVAPTSLGARLEFLDALRGIAAMVVVIEHICELQWPGFATFTLERFRFGEFGVVVFFLCSGFIIPASLERRGSLRDFWIGRVFRLFPMYWAALAAVLVLHFGLHSYRGLPDTYWTHWLRYTAVNVTMVQDFTGVPLTLGQSWTLAYEMAFYVAVSILFVAGVHRRSAWIAGFGLVVSAIVGNHLRTNALKTAGPRTAALAVVAVVLAVAIVWFLTRHASPVARLWCIMFAALLALALFNRYEPTFQAAFFLGTMFAGTTIYRWTQGEYRTRVLVLLGALVVAAVVIAQLHDWSPWLNNVPTVNRHFHQAEVLTYLGAYALFAVAVALRHRHFPRVLTYLGAISYSLYLVHPLVIYSVPDSLGRWTEVLVQLGGTILVSAVTYRLIEKPAIAAGRRLARALRASDRVMPEAASAPARPA